MSKDKIIQLIDAAVDSDPLTEDALALRFSERHAGDLRYIALRKQWFQWDGWRWCPEPTLRAFDLARQNCREAAQEYVLGPAPSRVYTAKTVAAVEQMARADRRQATALEQVDANDFDFNTMGKETR
jgi:putative DNA primase/helicase